MMGPRVVPRLYKDPVMGPTAPYAASAKKLVPPDQVAGIVGSELFVRAKPQNLAEFIVDEG
jgi:hypothetical protein